VRWVVLFTAALVGCQYHPSSSETIDGATTTDGPTGVDTSDPDSPPELCTSDGMRVCVDATHSGHCAGGAPVADRSCPPDSMCTDGLCAPPMGATQCLGDADCTNQVCDLYVVGSSLQGFCSDPIGTNTGSCSNAGEDLNCDSGICSSGNGTQCLSPCTTTGDCVGGSQTCSSMSNPQSIEGQSTSGTKHCVPD